MPFLCHPARNTRWPAIAQTRKLSLHLLLERSRAMRVQGTYRNDCFRPALWAIRSSLPRLTAPPELPAARALFWGFRECRRDHALHVRDVHRVQRVPHAHELLQRHPDICRRTSETKAGTCKTKLEKR